MAIFWDEEELASYAACSRLAACRGDRVPSVFDAFGRGTVVGDRLLLGAIDARGEDFFMKVRLEGRETLSEDSSSQWKHQYGVEKNLTRLRWINLRPLVIRCFRSNLSEHTEKRHLGQEQILGHELVVRKERWVNWAERSCRCVLAD